MREVWISGIILIVLFYVFLILPQQSSSRKRRKEMATLVPGDEVVTGGGLIGKVVGMETDRLVLELAPGINVQVMKGYVSYKLPPAPVMATEDGEDDEAEESSAESKD